mgnify:CR=1 FL=1
MTISDQLPDVIAWLFEDDPLTAADVENRARLLFLDTLGCMIAGLAKPEPAALALSFSELEPGPVNLPNAPPLALGSAAYLMGLAACWDEACEGLPRAHGRPGLHAFAAALPLALARRCSLGESLQALVVGFEVAGRLGECLRIRPGMHVDGTWGTFGAVAAAARLLQLPAAHTLTALQGAACQIPFSLYLPISQGATVRNTYVGEAARRGISSALAARAGIGSPLGAVEVFDELALAGAGAEKDLEPAGTWLLLEGYLKPFAAVRHVHYGAQAALEWRRQHQDISTIAEIELAIYGEALTYCGNRAPATAIQAQFSLSYGLAWALYQGDLGPEAYRDDSLQNNEVRRLEGLVKLVEATDYTKAGQRAARLTINGDRIGEVIEVNAVPGEPHLPLSQDQVLAKFVRYVAPVLAMTPQGEWPREF